MKPEKKLEQIFTKMIAYNHQMYNSYYEKKCKMTTAKMFREHYSNFKPTLNEILKKKHSLKSGGANAAKAALKLKNFKNFIEQDQINLFQRPYNRAARQAFYKQIEPSYPNIIKLGPYSDTLSLLGIPSRNLAAASDYYQNNPQEMADIFLANKVTTIPTHPDTDVAVDLFANHLKQIPDSDLEIITYYASNHEQFTLITLEPYMIFILGNALFFKLFVPLHQEGGTSHFVKKAIDKHLAIKYSYKEVTTRLIINAPKNMAVFYPFIQRHTTAGSTTMLLLSAAGAFYQRYWSPSQELVSPESTLVRDAVETLFTKKGLESRLLDSLRDSAGRVAFEIGSSIGEFSSRFVEGFASKHEPTIRAVAEVIDKSSTKALEESKKKPK